MGALISFLSRFFTTSLSWLFSVVVIKFLVFGVVFVVLSYIVPLVISILMPNNTDLASLMEGIPSEVAYLLSFFKIDVGIKLMFSAYLARFILRRIPFVG